MWRGFPDHDLLKLAALDSDDLAVISAQMQDAVLRVGAITQVKSRQQFALVANRFAWDSGQRERRRTGLHFDHVKSVQKQGFKNVKPETILSLLAISFCAVDGLSGHITLSFSAGHLLRLEVECVDVTLADMGPAWSTEMTPSHET